MSAAAQRRLGAHEFLERETRSLLVRVRELKPFILQETMLPAALLLPNAMVAIEEVMATERGQLRQMGKEYLAWLRGPGRNSSPADAQKRFTTLRFRFVNHLSTLELYSDAITQRSESENGLWLSGLDVAAADGLRIPGGPFNDPPPIICYLDRGPGAAIRRAHTRLPTGSRNPVAIIRMPRERMVGHGIASSLYHEVGHQGAALLDLVASLRGALRERCSQSQTNAERFAWGCWATWISEIVADFWSVSCIGVGSTLGLIGVVSLPRPFVFRFTLEDPHPFPWIRVMISSAIGERLYPAPHWAELRRLWTDLYPVNTASETVQSAIKHLAPTIDSLVDLIAEHRPPRLKGRSIELALRREDRDPQTLRYLGRQYLADPKLAARAAPTQRFAVLGQLRADGSLGPEDEHRIVGRMLVNWARQSTLDMARACATRPAVNPAPSRPRTTPQRTTTRMSA